MDVIPSTDLDDLAKELNSRFVSHTPIKRYFSDGKNIFFEYVSPEDFHENHSMNVFREEIEVVDNSVFDAVIESFTCSKLEAIHFTKQFHTNFGLVEAKNFVENKGVLKADIGTDEANEIINRGKVTGITISLIKK